MPLTGEAKREYQRLWIARRRQDWLNENSPCSLCGGTENLEVDHIDASTKEVETAGLWSLSLSNPKRIAELAKCRVLCHSCHIKKTFDCKEQARGEAVACAKLTVSLVREIREKYKAEQHSKRELAIAYKVDERAIRAVLNGESWKHVA